MRRWKKATEKRLVTHPLFNLAERTLTSGAERREVMILEAPDWINVVPVLPDGRLIFIRQWRYGVEDFTLEIPGGMVEPGESHAEAAKRELLEETGFSAGRVSPLGELHANPAFQTNRVSTWLATELEQVHTEVPGDGHEEIEVVFYPPEAVPELIRSQVITHSLVVAAFHLYSLRPAERQDPGVNRTA